MGTVEIYENAFLFSLSRQLVMLLTSTRYTIQKQFHIHGRGVSSYDLV